MQSSLENLHIAYAALKALLNERDRIMEAAMQGAPLDAQLVRYRLTEIELMYDAASTQIDSSASQPHAVL